MPIRSFGGRVTLSSFGGRVTLSLVGAGCLAATWAAAGTDTPLLDAVKNRDTEAVQVLVSQQVDVNAPQADGATALHWAAHLDDVEITDLLIGAGARVNTANDYGVVPLSLACTNGNVAMVERLLGAGADPNTGDGYGATPLMFAARTGRVEVVEALLAHGADFSVTDTAHGQTALMWAASEGHTRVQRVLLGAGADIHSQSTQGYTPLLFAVRENHRDSVRALLDHDADINHAAVDGTTSLVLATVLGHWPLAEVLLDHGADPNADGMGFTALHWAAGVWETALTTRAAGGTAGWGLLAGRGVGKLRLVETLLGHGANPNARLTRGPRTYGFGGFRRIAMAGATPFLVAARSADLAIMHVLLAAGADPMLNADDGTTPLMAAAGYAYAIGTDTHLEADALAAATLAVELGADVAAANTVGETALHAAAYTGWDSIVLLLLDQGAYVDPKNVVAWTPLAIASGFFDLTTQTKTIHETTMALLKKHGAAPTPPSHDMKRLRY